MSAVTRPRGPLPRRVYWTRRVLVLVLAFGLVFGISRLLGGGGGGAAPESATPVRSSPEPSPTSPVTPSASLAPGPKVRPSAGAGASRRPAAKLPAPKGSCDDSDVLVTPRVSDAHAGGDVTVVLELTTAEAEACTWEVSPDTVFLSITNDEGPVWSTQDCPDAVPTRAVVPRREHADKVKVVWPAKESDDRCSRGASWVLQGVYTATAIARGAVNPVDVGFVLGGPVTPTKTVTPTPTAGPSSSPSGSAQPEEQR